MGTPNKTLTKRQIIGYSIVAFIVLLFMASVTNSDNKAPSKTVQSEPIRYTKEILTPTPTPMPLSVKEQIKAVNCVNDGILFCMDYYAMHEIEITDNMSIYDAYAAFEKNQKIYHILSQMFQQIQYNDEFPKNLPEPLNEYLEESVSYGVTAFSYKEDWAKYSKKFLDDKKPSTLQKAKEKLGHFNRCMASASENIILAKKEVGLENEPEPTLEPVHFTNLDKQSIVIDFHLQISKGFLRGQYEIKFDDNMDDLKTYEALNKNQKLYKRIEISIRNIKIPEELPNPLKQYLIDAKENNRMAYCAKADWAKYGIKYLNDKKPSTQEKSMENLYLAIAYLSESKKYIKLAAKEVGPEVNHAGLLEETEND